MLVEIVLGEKKKSTNCKWAWMHFEVVVVIVAAFAIIVVGFSVICFTGFISYFLGYDYCLWRLTSTIGFV